MPTSHIYLQGGPCNGQTVSANRIVGGLVAYIKCKNGYYIDDAGKTRPNGNNIFKYAGKTAPNPPPGPGQGSGAYAPNVTHAWAHMQRSVNHDFPTSLKRLDYAMRRTLQTLSHHRRVR